MRICLVNNSRESDRDVLHVLRAINAQLVDFAYHWSVLAQLRLEGSRGKRLTMRELRGDAVIYLERDTDPDALGWHDADKYGVPHGVVHCGMDSPEHPWSVTLSHEVLELLLDPHANRLAAGPHPDLSGRTVMHWYEACDAVQNDTYKVAGIEVSDFVLPGYFTVAEEAGMRLSYLGADIPSFGIAPGGYVGFFDPVTQQHETSFADNVGKAAYQRKHGGRAARYQRNCVAPSL